MADAHAQMRFVPLQYRIATVSGSDTVDGFAVQLPAPFHKLRFCIRYASRWIVDHYDSGKSVNGPVCRIDAPAHVIRQVERWRNHGTSKTVTARWLIRYLRKLRKERHPILMRLLERAA